MENWKLYKTILDNPEGLEALQNTDILPAPYVRYSDALLVFERQYFPNSLADEKNYHYRVKIEQERIHLPNQYFDRCRQNEQIRMAEEQRTKARIAINDALYRDFIKSYVFKINKKEFLNKRPTKLSKEWWQSKSAFDIDALSLHFVKKADITAVHGLIALERKSLDKWGSVYPAEPHMKGRRKGTGHDDTQQIEFMKQVMIETKCSRHAAANKAVEKFGFKASREADVKRLNEKFSKTYPLGI